MARLVCLLFLQVQVPRQRASLCSRSFKQKFWNSVSLVLMDPPTATWEMSFSLPGPSHGNSGTKNEGWPPPDAEGR